MISSCPQGQNPEFDLPRIWGFRPAHQEFTGSKESLPVLGDVEVNTWRIWNLLSIFPFYWASPRDSVTWP